MMSKRIHVLLATIALACALPAGTAHALNSPTLNSPTLNSPTLNSPTLNSPTLNSPTLNSPTLNSPTLDSPTLDSPALDSPALDSPSLDAPASVVSNATANTIAGETSTLVSVADATTGVVMSPASGALNLATIAGFTAFCLAGALGASVALVRVLRGNR